MKRVRKVSIYQEGDGTYQIDYEYDDSNSISGSLSAPFTIIQGIVEAFREYCDEIRWNDDLIHGIGADYSKFKLI